MTWYDNIKHIKVVLQHSYGVDGRMDPLSYSYHQI